MELDNFKNLWNKDKQDLPEVSVKRHNKIYSPLDMIRTNMKTEFWLLIITLPIMFYGTTSATKDDNTKIISILQVILSSVFFVYFYSRFLKLYKLLNRSSINTNYDLFNLRTQLLISKETYISYYISYIPLALIMSLIKIRFQFDKDYHTAIFAMNFVIGILFICFMKKYWIHYMYGKYVQQVVDVVDELNGVDFTPNTKKENSWFEKSQTFFMKKYGIKGNVMNTIVWFVFGYILIIIFLLIVILLVIFICAQLNLLDMDSFLKAVDETN